jgi:hypothetical protein
LNTNKEISFVVELRRTMNIALAFDMTDRLNCHFEPKREIFLRAKVSLASSAARSTRLTQTAAADRGSLYFDWFRWRQDEQAEPIL